MAEGIRLVSVRRGVDPRRFAILSCMDARLDPAKYAGLSECTSAELRRAHAVFPVSCVQMEYSLAERGIEASLLPTCKELGVGVVAYSPLGRGFLAANFSSAAELPEGDHRRTHPREFVLSRSTRNIHRQITHSCRGQRWALRPALPGQIQIQLERDATRGQYIA